MKYLSIVTVWLAFIVLSFLFVLPRPGYAKEKSQVLIMNQVRGEECCDKGNLENLSTQIKTNVENNIPAVFVIRYDILNNPKYLDLLKNKSKEFPSIVHLGLLLEITPDLAKDSGTAYPGNKDSWFEAQNLFSIGYSDEDNIKMADKLFETFHNNFGYYPSITSSWMIKTSLLNYLSQRYGVKVHQITREQWGTDSYSLYGGPPHYPYPASSSWAFMPDYKAVNAPLIVRQTITDPLYNYGDKTSSFTSQPNDYLRNKDFSYFEALLKQAIGGQRQTGFALLGLENSMDKKYQNEYIKQIKLLKNYRDDGLVSFPEIIDLYDFWSKQKLSLYEGKDLIKPSNNQAFWITTPFYRIRLRNDNNNIYISDIRVYNSRFNDPYDNQVAEKEGFWISPFLLDGSLENKNLGFTFFQQPSSINKFLDVKNDLDSNLSKIEFPSLKSGTNLITTPKTDQININYQSKDGKSIKLTFLDSSILINGMDAKELVYKSNSPPLLSNSTRSVRRWLQSLMEP